MADQIELDSLYSQAQAALKAKQYDRASDLLRQILLADENYKDASRLLARAVRLRRRRWYSHPLLWGVIGIAALAVIGIWAAPQLGRFYASRVAQPTNRPTNTETPSLTPTPAPTAVPLAWKRISIGLEFPRDAIVSALIDENDSDVMYVGTRSAGVYRSIDGGLSWQPDHDPEIEQRLSSSVFRPPEGEGSSPVISINAENGETYSYRLSGGIVEESKNGKPWQYLLATRCSYLLEYSESQAFAYCGKLYSLPTADPVGRALPIVDFSAVDWGGVPLAIAVSAQSPDIIIIGGEWGLFITKDGGETWEERTNGLGSRTVELTISPQGLFFAQDRSTFDPGGNGGWACNLYRSLDRAQTWTKLPKAVANTGCGLSFSADGNTLFLNDASWNVRNSTDNGDSSIPWGGSRQSNKGQFYITYITPHPKNGDILFVVNTNKDISDDYHTGLYVSLDAGNTWVESIRDAPRARLYFDHDDGSVIYLVSYEEGDSAIFRSFDSGRTWRSCGGTSIPAHSDQQLVIDPRDSDRVFLATSHGMQFSLDGCDSWSPSFQDWGTQSVYAIAIDPNNGNTLYVGTSGGALVSFDAGETWSQINEGLLGVDVVYSIVVDENSNVYTATPYGIFTLESQ